MSKSVYYKDTSYAAIVWGIWFNPEGENQNVFATVFRTKVNYVENTTDINIL